MTFGGNVKKKIITVLTFLCLIPFANATDFGLSAGFGAPFVSQYGLDISFGPNWGLSLSQNNLSVESGVETLDLNSKMAMVNWHIFSGAFYIGLGWGQEELGVSAKDLTTSLVASANVSTTSIVGRIGWMWGKADAGFWFGTDVSFISPSGADIEIVAPGLTSSDSAFQDAEDAAEQFGSSTYANITFIRLGYLF